MQIVHNGDSLHEMSNLFSGKNKKNIINLSFVELAQIVVEVKDIGTFLTGKKYLCEALLMNTHNIFYCSRVKL